jgi:homocitrate synthase NifV
MADPDFLVDLVAAGRDGGAERFGLADSTGVATPETMAYLVRRVRDAAGGHPVSVHTHNDFGLGVANAIAGLRAGATIADVSVLGLGERAGNAPTEQLAVALEGLYGVSTGLVLDRLHSAVRRIAAIANVPVPGAQPVVGDDIFAQKLEMHVAVTAREPSLHEPFEPGLVGGRRQLRLGSGSGEVAIRTKLEELDLEAPGELVGELVRWVNDEAAGTKRDVSDPDFARRVLERGGRAR